jgi:hypothetical protein
MAAEARRRFRTAGDWYDFLPEAVAQQQQGIPVNLYDYRRACYADIEKLRKRPLFVYAAKTENVHPAAQTPIEIGDVDGFTDLINTVGDADAIDVLIHSAGGSPEATERIVGVLRTKFKDVAFLIPHSAYSAATMLAMSGNEIIMHPSATLGPIDPQINGIPARAIQKGFTRVRDLLRDNPEALPAYIPLIEKHSLEILEICDDALELSKELVTSWLQEYMFEGDKKFEQTIRDVVEYFSDYTQHKTHARPLTYAKIKKFELKITVATDPLAELLREAYIVINGFFGSTPFVKIYENSKGLSWGRQFQMVQAIAQQAMIPKPGD